ncbi:MAG: aspartate--tRNA ligase [Nanoarchaeota archaeon]|nr:aspartate--tRNA ligase [Nanoarchaeota archaeon]
MLRTHTCGELRKSHSGKKVRLCGWIDSVRNFGKLWFIDLRDRYGKTQIVFREGEIDKKLLKELTIESCIGVRGRVKERKDKNKKILTGDVEVSVIELEIFTKCPPLPFDIKKEASEEIRLKYRYLDLRTERMQKNLMLRHKVYKVIHDYMDEAGFINFDTPILAKSTPEGARDYVVPSRISAGKFYALPQSPQIFKQLSMISGFDKYYQIARCFRDEDLRADRQPEFTQLDVEMSFVEAEDVLREVEKLIKFMFKQVLNVNVKTPFPRLKYEEVMKKYGKDSPDIRKKESKEKFSFLWVLNFPMFEYNKEEKRWKAMHHPFTSPEDGADFKDLKGMKAKAYDLVLNGSEIGGGSIRISDKGLQERVFEALGIEKKEAENKFGFLLKALGFGAPPHGGIAFGLDRMIMIMAGEDSIREIIPFPKNKNAYDSMMDSPSEVSDQQLEEVGLKLCSKKK